MTGSGQDPWIVASKEFKRWLAKHVAFLKKEAEKKRNPSKKRKRAKKDDSDSDDSSDSSDKSESDSSESDESADESKS